MTCFTSLRKKKITSYPSSSHALFGKTSSISTVVFFCPSWLSKNPWTEALDLSHTRKREVGRPISWLAACYFRCSFWVLLRAILGSLMNSCLFLQWCSSWHRSFQRLLLVVPWFGLQTYTDMLSRFPHNVTLCLSGSRGAPDSAQLCTRVSFHTLPLSWPWTASPDSLFPCSDSTVGLLTSFPASGLSHSDLPRSCRASSIFPRVNLSSWVLHTYKGILGGGTFIKPHRILLHFP